MYIYGDRSFMFMYMCHTSPSTVLETYINMCMFLLECCLLCFYLIIFILVFTYRRRAARQKRKSSAHDNGATVPHGVLLTNGIRQRKAQPPAGSGPGKCFPAST